MAIILVADDHPLNRHFLATLLSYYGHQINEAADGVEALDSARREKPDLLIADVAMPRMDGFTLVGALRAERELAAIPVIFYTASYRELESRAIAHAAGVEHLITKPSDPEVILDVVEKALGAPSRLATAPGSSEQARRYTEGLQSTGIRMSALIELSLELHTERDPDRLMRTACRAVRTIFDANDAMIAVTGEPQESWVDGEIEESNGGALRARVAPFAGRAVSNASDRANPVVAALADVLPDTRAILLLPMLGNRDLYGWILLGRRGAKPAFSLDDERLALAAASDIRAAHENLTLYRAQRRQAAALSREHEDLESRIDQRTSELRLSNEALHSSHARLRALSARVLSIQETERTHLARELHDDLGQLLTAIKIDASRLVQDVANGAAPAERVLTGLVPLIDMTLDTVRRLVTELRPSLIGEMGLVAAIEKKLADFQQRTDIECKLSIRGGDVVIGGDVATAVFRILEEALTNVVRHSGATRVDVHLEKNNEVLLEIRDNGRGIRESERDAPNAHGLLGMKERAHLLGGTVTVAGAEGEGTIVTARIPR